MMCAIARGQTAAEPLVFDAAVMRQDKSGANGFWYDESPSGLFSVRNITLSNLFQDAFHVRRDAMIGAPGWFDSERFDVSGKAPPGTTDEKFMLMTQSLLMEQFRMRVHREQRVQEAFVLTAGKGGPKMRKSEGKDEPDCDRVRALPNEYGGQHFACTNMNMAGLVEKLGTDVGRGYIDRTVLDRTGLTGRYDFRLSFTPFRSIDQGGITIFGALEQVGLKLEEKKAPLPVVVIDHVERFVPELE